jgi:hypothetical protein
MPGTGDVKELIHAGRNQGKRHETMGDGSIEWAKPGGLFGIGMQPVGVTRQFCKSVDHWLIDGSPAAAAKFGVFVRDQVGRLINTQHFAPEFVATR